MSSVKEVVISGLRGGKKTEIITLFSHHFWTRLHVCVAAKRLNNHLVFHTISTDTFSIYFSQKGSAWLMSACLQRQHSFQTSLKEATFILDQHDREGK